LHGEAGGWMGSKKGYCRKKKKRVGGKKKRPELKD
jgi:hypothetical protein